MCFQNTRGHHRVDIPIPKQRNRKEGRGEGSQASPKCKKANSTRSQGWRIVLFAFQAQWGSSVTPRARLMCFCLHTWNQGGCSRLGPPPSPGPVNSVLLLGVVTHMTSQSPLGSFFPSWGRAHIHSWIALQSHLVKSTKSDCLPSSCPTFFPTLVQTGSVSAGITPSLFLAY